MHRSMIFFVSIGLLGQVTPPYPSGGKVYHVNGDLICAHAGDTTINNLTITGATNAAPIVLTVSSSPVTAGYYVNLPITVAGVSPSAYNGAYTITALNATTITLSNGIAPGSGYSSGGTTGMTCGNVTDAIHASPQVFQTTFPIPTNQFASSVLTARSVFSFFSIAANPAISDLLLYKGSTLLYSAVSAGTLSASLPGYVGSLDFLLFGLDSTHVITSTLPGFSATGGVPGFANSTNQPVVVSASQETGSMQLAWTASGLGPATYTSGITATGTVGQTCNLTTFNGAGGSNGTATVALTGTNTIAGGTALVITNTGSGYTGVSTTAAAGNGTATCSGTATISMAALGGAQGIATQLLGFVVRTQ